MSISVTQRPGVYSEYDAFLSSAYKAGAKIIGIAAKTATGAANQKYLISSEAQAKTTFGSDATDIIINKILSIAFKNGASSIIVVPVLNGDYQTALSVLQTDERVKIIMTDSDEDAVIDKLKLSAVASSQARMERVAIAGAKDGKTVSQLTSLANTLNCERLVLVAPALYYEGLTKGAFTAAAFAGILSSNSDVSAPLNNASLTGSVSSTVIFSDADLESLISNGVTPLECLLTGISIVRAVTTKTKTANVVDLTFLDLTTILIIDDVLSSIRNSLKVKFNRAKNNSQTREAIKSQTIVELDAKKQAGVIDGYQPPKVSVSATDNTVCVVELGVDIANGLNQIHINAHISV